MGNCDMAIEILAKFCPEMFVEALRLEPWSNKLGWNAYRNECKDLIAEVWDGPLSSTVLVRSIDAGGDPRNEKFIKISRPVDLREAVRRCFAEGEPVRS